MWRLPTGGRHTRQGDPAIHSDFHSSDASPDCTYTTAKHETSISEKVLIVTEGLARRRTLWIADENALCRTSPGLRQSPLLVDIKRSSRSGAMQRRITHVSPELMKRYLDAIRSLRREREPFEDKQRHVVYLRRAAGEARDLAPQMGHKFLCTYRAGDA